MQNFESEIKSRITPLKISERFFDCDTKKHTKIPHSTNVFYKDNPKFIKGMRKKLNTQDFFGDPFRNKISENNLNDFESIVKEVIKDKLEENDNYCDGDNKREKNIMTNGEEK